MKPTRLALLVAGLLATLLTLHANEPPPGANELITPDDIRMFAIDEMNHGSAEFIEVDGPGFTEAIRISSTGRNEQWDAESAIELDRSFEAGEVLLMRLWVRKVASSDESTQVMVQASVSMREAPWANPLDRRVSVSGDWEEVWIRGVTERDFEPGKLFLKLSCGMIQQTLDIGGVSLWSYGTDYDVTVLPETLISYVGMEPDAPWREDAAARIREHRTAPLIIKVIDTTGNPVPDAEVEVSMMRHHFHFGAAVNASEIAGPDRDSNRVHRARFLSLFNSASLVNDTKWEAWTGEWTDAFNRTQTMSALAWFRAYHIPVRGHVLVWPSWHNMPDFMNPENYSRTPEQTLDLILARIDEVTSMTAHLFDEWDVLNEPRHNHDIMDMVGYEVMAEWFKRAQERHPNARLAVNEFGMLPSSGDAPTIEPYLETVQRIRDDGGPVSMLGIQGHMGGAFTPPTRLYQILNRLAEPELPIRINEFTLRQEQEAVAERYAADFLTVMFSHPSVIGVHTWTFDVMFNEDGSHTPAGRAWHQLIRETWWTDEEAATNLSGEVTVPEAYYGQYRVVIRRDGMELDTWVRHIPNGSPFILHLR